MSTVPPRKSSATYSTRRYRKWLLILFVLVFKVGLYHISKTTYNFLFSSDQPEALNINLNETKSANEVAENHTDDKYIQLTEEVEGYKKMVTKLQEDLQRIMDQQVQTKNATEAVQVPTIIEKVEKKQPEKVMGSIVSKQNLYRNILEHIDEAIDMLNIEKQKSTNYKLADGLVHEQIFKQIDASIVMYSKLLENKNVLLNWIKEVYQPFRKEIREFRDIYGLSDEGLDKKSQKAARKELKRLLTSVKDLKASFPAL